MLCVSAATVAKPVSRLSPIGAVIATDDTVVLSVKALQTSGYAGDRLGLLFLSKKFLLHERQFPHQNPLVLGLSAEFCAVYLPRAFYRNRTQVLPRSLLRTRMT